MLNGKTMKILHLNVSNLNLHCCVTVSLPLPMVFTRNYGQSFDTSRLRTAFGSQSDKNEISVVHTR